MAALADSPGLERFADAVTLGRITGVHGVRGWIRVHSYTEPREAVVDYPVWWLDCEGRRQKAKVAEGRRHGKTVIARLDGIEDRDQAAALIGSDIAVPRDALPPPGEGRYYWSDLEGCRVERRDGRQLGTVAYLMETGAHDVMVIDGAEEILVPFAPGETVLDVDLARGVIRVDWDWE